MMLQLMGNAFLNKKWLNFFENAVFNTEWCKTIKTLVSTENIEQSTLE